LCIFLLIRLVYLYPFGDLIVGDFFFGLVLEHIKVELVEFDFALAIRAMVLLYALVQ